MQGHPYVGALGLGDHAGPPLQMLTHSAMESTLPFYLRIGAGHLGAGMNPHVASGEH